MFYFPTDAAQSFFSKLNQLQYTVKLVTRHELLPKQLFKNVAERGKVARTLMAAHEAYRAGKIDTALLQYAMLAELGYEVAQSNVAFILDHGKICGWVFSRAIACQR